MGSLRFELSAASSICWSNGRIALRCRGDGHRIVIGRLPREVPVLGPSAGREHWDNAARAGRNLIRLRSQWMWPGKESRVGRKWPPSEEEDSSLSRWRARFGTAGDTRRVPATNEGGNVGARGRATTAHKPEDARRATFERWAAVKLQEDGPSALPAIDEIRRALDLTSPMPDEGVAAGDRAASGMTPQPKMAVPEVGMYRHAAGGSNPAHPATRERQGATAWRWEREGVSGEEERGPPGIGQGGSRTFVARSGAPLSTTVDRRSGRNAMPVRNPVAENRRRPWAANSGDAVEEVPDPLFVQRSTKLPVNWKGPGGTVMLVDKPQGWTSFAVCSKLRHLLKIQKVGHAGTLDPLATGLLIVCLGKATKLADSFQALTKVYSGTVRLGETTPSLDAFTEVSSKLPWEHITDEQLEQAKQEFVGDIFQKPPMYSAIKVCGERLYMKARRGEEIEVQSRLVTVNDFQLERSSVNRQEIHFKATCSKGTYVRSLCADLAQSVGSCAHLTALRREKIGALAPFKSINESGSPIAVESEFSVKNAWPMQDFLEEYTFSTSKVGFRGGNSR